MQRSNWNDALLLWHHLHPRKLVSPGLYLDAARCFGELGQNQDLVRALNEALETLGPQATADFLEQAGDIALGIDSEPAQQLAIKAYEAVSDRLRETISSETPPPATGGASKPK